MSHRPDPAPPGADDATADLRREGRRAAPSRRFLLALLAIAIVALSVRLVDVLVWNRTIPADDEVSAAEQLEEHPDDFVLWSDALGYHEIAHSLADGEGFVDPAAEIWFGRDDPVAPRPLYPLYLAAWTTVGVDGVTGHRVVSTFLGVAAVLVIGLLARRLGGDLAGLSAAAIAAVYPQLWINDGMLLTESAAILTTMVTLYAVYAFWESPSWWRAAGVGATAGLAVLSRSELLLLFPVVVIPFALLARDAELRRRVGFAAVACGAGTALVLPWVGYNLSRFEEPTFLTGGSGAVLSAASCDETFYGDRIGFYADCFPGPYLLPPADESERDLVAREYAIDYTKDHLDRLPLVVAARVGRVWNVYAPGQTTFLDWSVERRGRTESWIGLVAFYALLPAAIGGLVVMRRRRIPILPLVAVFAAVTLAVAASFGVTRYRAVAEGPIVVAAAIGLAAAWQWWTARRDGRPRTRSASAPRPPDRSDSTEPVPIGSDQ